MKQIMDDYLWTREQLSGSLDLLACAAGSRNKTIGKPTADLETGLNFEDWLNANLVKRKLEADRINITHGDLKALLQELSPALLEYAGTQHKGFLVLLQRRRGKAVLLKPDKTTGNITLHDLESMLSDEQRANLRPELDNLLDVAGMNPDDQTNVLNALLRERIKDKFLGKCWRVRLSPGSDFWQQIRHAGALPLFFGFFLSHAAAYGILLIFWSLLGIAVFAQASHVNTSWMLAGLLLLLTPLRLLSPWLFGILSARIGERLKQRLLYGALRLEPDEIRHQGLGQFLGRVIESEAIESSAMRGSGNIFMGLIQLMITVPYLVFGTGGWLLAFLLFVWLFVSLVVGWHYINARVLWTRTRLDLTNDLVEQLLGYRTRLAQQPRAEWHIQEDKNLADYDRLSAEMDLRVAWLKALVPYGWTLVGLLALIPLLMASWTTVANIGFAISGIVFASVSFQQIAEGLTQFADAWVAWNQVKLLFDAAARPSRSAHPEVSETILSKEQGALLTAANLGFQYGTRSEEILKDCNFSINVGDRILLLGASGSGKSTLVAVLSGLRSLQKGMLTWGRISEKDVGERAWRKRIVAAPQFHENHIFTGTFAFNLLMGRQWPPAIEDLQKAKQICIALGLDKLLEEMPGGMFQFVGETGWQLSHGEKSRVYIARALLQGADIIILDESFSALDSGSLRQSLECVVEHAPTLVVVAHP